MKNFKKIGLICGFAVLLAMTAFSFGNSDYSDGQNTLSLDVFPNPVTGNEFTVTANTNISEVVIVNILGQQVFDQQFNGDNKINIELEIKEKGVYLIQVKTDDGRVATKRILFK
jgi:hypothetical protein